MSLLKNIQSGAAQCVKCGLCATHCPTYKATLQEGESPRGRIALMQGIANKALPIDSTLKNHLDNCLNCLACEQACPAHVPYGDLIDMTREILAITPHHKPTFNHTLLYAALTQPKLLRLIITLLRGYQRMGFSHILKHTPILKHSTLARYAMYLPPLSRYAPLKKFYATHLQPQQGTVALFTGCLTPFLSQHTALHYIALLNHLGFNVVIPTAQRCCGGLYLHSGQAHKMRPLAHINVQAFNALNVNAIVSINTGCTAVLQDYVRHPSLRHTVANDTLGDTQLFSQRIIDMNTFLAHANWPDTLKWQPENRRIAVHIPCSLRYRLKQLNPLIQLLQRIPNINLITLPQQDCCGGAGTYMLERPQLASEFQRNTVHNLLKLRPELIVTANIGCALQLRYGFNEIGVNLPIMHAGSLIARALKIIK